MQKIIFFVIILIIPLSLADNEKGLETLDSGKLDVIEMFDIDNDKGNNDGQRKRDSGYAYPRSNRPIKFESYRSTKGPGRYVTRLPENIVKPFAQYGPPRQTSPGGIRNNRQKFRSPSQRHKNRYQHNYHSNTGGIKFPENIKSTGSSQLNVSNFIKGFGPSSESNPIASQNEVPFNHNTANYLPPKNQKLPPYSSNLHSIFNANVNQQNPQLSDAVQFLTQNAQAISQLYETPATNLNYAPTPEDFDEFTNNQSPTSNNQFQTFDMASSSHQSQLKQNADTFNTQLPSYSSGILETQRALNKILTEEKNRLIIQLQQSLTSPIQNTGNYYETPKLHDTPVKLQNQNDVEAFTDTKVNSGHTSFHGTPVTSYGTPVNPITAQLPSTISLTSSSTSNDGANQRPQSPTVTGNSHVPTLVTTPSGQPSAPLPFPPYGGFLPTVITASNYVNGFPPHYSSTFIGTNPSSSPTHFNIPIGTDLNNKPILGSASASTDSFKPTFPPLPTSPSIDHSVSLPIAPGHPIQPTLPINSASIPLQKPTIASHPHYGVHPTLINSVILKPVKTVYPVYYYPNAAYQLQKPSSVALATYPLNYAPSHWQTKHEQTWK